MADILTRGVPDEVAQGLRHLAVSLNISPNQLRIWLFEEAALPYGDLSQAMRERAEEVSRERDKKLVIRGEAIPHPDSWTQPLRRRKGSDQT